MYNMAKCDHCGATAVHPIKREDGKEFWFCNDCCFCGRGDHIVVVREARSMFKEALTFD